MVSLNLLDPSEKRKIVARIRAKKWYHDNRDKALSRIKGYRFTLKGKLRLTYKDMKLRVTGVHKGHIYEGLPICSYKEFTEWSLANKDFLSLFDRWQKSDWAYLEGPSIDRINPNEGYILGNMQWLSVREHNDKSWEDRRKK